MKSICAVLLLCCAVNLRAQSIAAVAPRESVFPDMTSAVIINHVEAPAPKVDFLLQKTAPQPRPSNRGFFVLAAVSAAAMVADVELTSNCLRTVANCREANPLMGSDPNRARLYAVNVPIYLGEVVFSRILKGRYPERKLWSMPLLSVTGTHVVGVASNIRAR